MKSLSPRSFDLTMDPPPVRTGPLSLLERIGIAREMLITLKEATRSGQRHVMLRALNILQSDILRPTLRLTKPQVVTVMAAVTELEHEAARAAPDISVFCSRATLVIEILSIS